VPRSSALRLERLGEGHYLIALALAGSPRGKGTISLLRHIPIEARSDEHVSHDCRGYSALEDELKLSAPAAVASRRGCIDDIPVMSGTRHTATAFTITSSYFHLKSEFGIPRTASGVSRVVIRHWGEYLQTEQSPSRLCVTRRAALIDCRGIGGIYGSDQNARVIKGR
jgi:hypothetical protein